MTRITAFVTVLVFCGFWAWVLQVSAGHPLADFDFSTGTVRCAVAGLSTSCGSVTP